MKKISCLSFTLLSLLTVRLHAQEKTEVAPAVLNKSYVGLFGNRLFFQDTRFSNILYQGYAGTLELGFSQERKRHFWDIDVSGAYAPLRTSLHGEEGYMINLSSSFQYVYSLTTNLAVGAKWRMVDINDIVFPDLVNNSHGGLTNSTLMLSGRYRYPIRSDIGLSVGLSLGLFGWVKDGYSFAYGVSQEVILYLLKYGKWRTIGCYHTVETELTVHYKRRWAFTYQWRLLNHSSTRNRPITLGEHRLGVVFNYLHRGKSASKTKTTEQ